jgi:hypothetical protein
VKLLALAVAIVMNVAQAPTLRGLTGAAQLARVYDAILDAQFEQAAAELSETCPPTPQEV